MDGKRFDRMARAIAGGTTRRGLLGGLAALLVGGRTAGLVSAQESPPCPLAGQTRNRKGDCLCPAGTDPCREAGICADRKRDPFNCGRCGRSCDGGECVKGECRTPATTPAPGCTSDSECPPGEVCVLVGGSTGICKVQQTAGTVVNAPVATVWGALTDAKTLTSLGIPNDIAPKVGHRFHFRPIGGATSSTPISGEVVEVEHLRRIAFLTSNGPAFEATLVTFTFEPVGDGSATVVRMSQTDPSGRSCVAAARVLGPRWERRLLSEALPRYLGRS